jgi:hypothetical protein
MNSLEFLYELSWAKSNPLKLDSFAALPTARAPTNAALVY